MRNTSRLTTFCRAITLLWAGVSGVQFAIWVLMCLIGGHFAPAAWWLWTAACGGFVVSALWFTAQRARHADPA